MHASVLKLTLQIGAQYIAPTQCMLVCPGVSYSEALGSARGGHSLGPSDSDSEMGDTHSQAMEETGRDPPSMHKAPQKLHTGHTGADTFHEAASSRCGPPPEF